MNLILRNAVTVIFLASCSLNTASAQNNRESIDTVVNNEKICSFTEASTLTLRLNSTVETASNASEKLKKYEKEIKQAAKKEKIDTIELTRTNFSLNSNNKYQQNISDAAYRLSGSISFNVAPYEKALKLLDKLKDKGYEVSLNVSSFKNSC